MLIFGIFFMPPPNEVGGGYTGFTLGFFSIYNFDFGFDMNQYYT